MKNGWNLLCSNICNCLVLDACRNKPTSIFWGVFTLQFTAPKIPATEVSLVVSPRPTTPTKTKAAFLKSTFLGGEQVLGAPKTKMTMDFHDQFEDVFDIKNGDFLVSILVFREGTIRKICQLCTFQMTTRLSWSSWTIPKKLLEIATVVNLNIKEISVSLKHFRLQLFWNQHDDEKQQETASIEWCCWFHLKLGVGIYMLPISCKYEILLSKLIRISGYLLVSRKGGDIWWIICVVASFLKCINLVPQRTPSFFSKFFEASPGLWKKRSTESGGKATGGPKNTGVAMVDFEIDIKKVSWIPKHVEDWTFRRAIGVEDSKQLL